MSTKLPAMILHRGPNQPGHYVWSPFVTKTEFRLRVATLPYTSGSGGPSSGPKGKIPYLSLSAANDTPEILSDSTLIPKALVSKNLMHDLNARLSAKDRATDLAIRSLLEDKLHYCNIKERWVDNFYTMRDFVMANIPWPMRVVVGNLAYRGNVRKLNDQGMGRFSDDEIRGFRREIWESVNAFLDDGRKKARGEECWWVLGGEKPTDADATVYGYVVSALVAEAGPESGRLLREEFGGVVEWAGRVHGRYFEDYQVWK